MITIPFSYAAPSSLDEAVTVLTEESGAKILAGGQSLVTEIKLHQTEPSMLVDLRKIQALRTIVRLDNGHLRIGAMATFTEIAAHKAVQESYSALIEAVNSTLDAQARNCSTLGGNLAQSDVGADLPAIVLTLDATLNIIGAHGSRTISADEFCTGKATLTRDEIITSLDFPPVIPGAVNLYVKFRNRANGYAICGVAANVVLTPDGTVRACRLAVTGVTKHALRLFEVEGILLDKQLTVEAIATAVWSEQVQHGISDLAASTEYRAYLTKVLTERAIARIIAHMK